MKLVSICREYVTAIRIKAAVADAGKDIVSPSKLEKGLGMFWCQKYYYTSKAVRM